MTWFTENWFWILIFVAFIAMHLVGHGGHGGHGSHSGHEDNRKRNDGETPGGGRPVGDANATSDGHRH